MKYDIMDYKLEWKIHKRIGGPIIPNSSHVRLTPYPAIDYVNPGCDAKLYQFYVPIHGTKSPHIIDKKVENIVSHHDDIIDDKSKKQIGLGIEKRTVPDNNIDSDTNIDSSDVDIDPILFNNAKKSRLGESIQNNFLHPKIIETGKLTLSNEMSPANSETSHKKILKGSANVMPKNKRNDKKETKAKTIKHKFLVV